MKLKIRFRFLAIVSIVFLCIGVTIRELQNDTFYMIKLGEYIHSYGIDFMDHWSFIPNLSYTYPHWLYDLFVFYVYKLFSFEGIYVSTILLFILLIFIIYWIQLKVNKSEFMALFVSIISISALYGFATARAQLITAILFLLVIYFLEKLIDSGKKIYIVILTIFSFLIANLHATIWLFAFILYFPFLGEHIVWKVKCKFFSKEVSMKKILICKVTYFKELVVSFVCSFLMGIFTPSRICYTYIFRVMMGDSQSFIKEHAPLVVIEHPLFIAFLVTLLLILIFSNIKMKLRELFMILGLVLMALFSVRHLIFVYTIGLFYLSRLCIRYLKEKKDSTLDILGNYLVCYKSIYFLVMILISIFSYQQFQKNQELDFINQEEYPVEASIFIKKHLDLEHIRLYNDYNYGSYLMFQDIPVFIDSRCDLYLREFNSLSYSVFEDKMEMEYKYQEKFDFYGITHVLIQKNSLFYQILRDRENYDVIYEDSYFILFERL